MVALKLFVYCLDGQVNVDFAGGKVRAVQGLNVRLVKFSAGHLHELDGSVDFHFDKRNGCGFDEFEACDPGLLLEKLLELFKSAFESGVFRHVHKVIKNGVINSNVDVTVLDGDARGA